MSNASIHVKTLDSSDISRWDAFVEAAPQATFCHRAGWKTVIERAFGHQCHYLYAERDGRIEGVLPLAHVRSRLFANALISTPFCVYGGIVAETDEARSALDNKACELAQELDVEYLELRQIEADEHSPRLTKDLYYTFRRDIVADADENLKRIPRKQRAVVRKGIKSGMQSTIDTDIDRFYTVYSESVRNLGTPVFSKKYPAILQDVFGDDCEILTITHDDQVVASVMSFYFRDEVLPYYGGGGELARKLKGNDFMYWELMRRAGERGSRQFDFGRSKAETGPFRFKKHWGFEPQPLNYQYELVRSTEMPNLSPTNPRYERAINLWKKLPLGVTQILGPPLAKDLG